MSKFKYVAVDNLGKRIKGDCEAADENTVFAMLRARGLYPVRVSEAYTELERAFETKISLKVMGTFCLQTSTILTAGVPIATAFNIMSEQTENKALRKILSDVTEAIGNGRKLTDAFAPYQHRLPLMFMNMLEAGEASGAMDVCLKRAGESFMKTNRLNNKVRGAMVYPSVLLVITLAITVFLLAVVVPLFVDVYRNNNVKLPAPTAAILAVSSFLTNNWHVILGIIVVAAIAFRLWISTESGHVEFDGLKIRMPMFGKLYLKVCTSRYTRALATLTYAGLPLTSALEISGRAVQNRYLRRAVEHAVMAVSNGEALSDALQCENAFPSLLITMTRLGEESGQAETLLLQTADFYDDEAETSLQTMAALMEPLAIIVMAAVVIFVVMSVILPVMNMTTLIGG